MKFRKNQLKELQTRMLEGKDVSRRRLFRVIGPTALAKMEKEWRAEVQSRGHKPPEIAEYAKRLGVALRKYGKADLHCVRGSTKAGRLFEVAEADFEYALEYLIVALDRNPDLRFWIDRDIDFNDLEFGYSPRGMPYPIWSKSPYARKAVIPKRRIRDFKREALEEALEKLQKRAKRKPEPLPDMNAIRRLRGCSDVQDRDFSGWKF